MFRLHLEAAVLVADPFYHRVQFGEVADVGRIGKDRAGEAALLPAVHLVDRVKNVVQLGVGLEHRGVECPRDRLTIGAKRGNGRADDIMLGDGQHCSVPLPNPLKPQDSIQSASLHINHKPIRFECSE